MYIWIIDTTDRGTATKLELDRDFTLALSNDPNQGYQDALRVVVHVGLSDTFDRVSVSVHDPAEGVDVYTHKGELLGTLTFDQFLGV